MDLLIKNMEKPKDCWDCPLKTTWHTPNGLHGCCRMVPSLNFQPYQKPFDNCPLVEVPPHGRLIDADELQDVLGLVLSLVISNELTEKEISLVHRTIGAISEAINDLNTVLEATE